MRASSITICALSGFLVACGFAARKEAHQFISTHFHSQHSDLGHLQILAPCQFARVEKREIPGGPPLGPSQIAGTDEYSVAVSFDPSYVSQWGSAAPSKSQVEPAFEGLGKDREVHLENITLDGHPGVLASTTALGFDKPAWTVIYFGANGLMIQASGSDTRETTRQVCEETIRSVKFDH